MNEIARMVGNAVKRLPDASVDSPSRLWDIWEYVSTRDDRRIAHGMGMGELECRAFFAGCIR